MLTRRALLLSFPLLPLMAAPAFSRTEINPPRREVEFIALSPFTVNLPVPPTARRRDFVIIAVTLETQPDVASHIREQMPRVQDAVLRRLIDMSARGLLRPNATDPLVVKDSIFDVVSRFQRQGVRDVLITQILHS